MEVHEQMKNMRMGKPPKPVDMDAIVVPVGGGGLIAGISVAMKHLSPNTQVIVRVLILAAKLCRKWVLYDLGFICM